MVPAVWPQMIEEATMLGINDTTPILDTVNAFSAVFGEVPISEIGIREFMRLVRKLIREIEEGDPQKTKKAEIGRRI